MLRTKAVGSAINRDQDGLRILATRFRGRGMRSTRYDVWLPALAPSERLIRKFQRGGISWTAFSREYVKELLLDGPIDQRSDTIKNHGQKSLLRLIKHLARRGRVTLMCHCAEDESECHRHVLKKFLLGPKV